MDFSKLHNPYDFANPVADPELFVGRSAEMNEIKYYLDHASSACRPINLAIMGARASGKTSILNMIQLEAEKRGFCVVRVDLDEGDAETQLAFFCKIFDSVLTTVVDAFGAYGGLMGKTYDTYRDMLDAYEIPEDRTFCPFIFPIQYAKAMNKGNTGAALSDTAFKRDISGIRRELDCPVAVLFDECDVLTRSRVHLEKLRNIFMNTPGFMLVFTGTPALFPLMDDVFSPIVRQFKKINLGPFDEVDETEDCIRKPLEKIGIRDPSEIFDFETYRDVGDIHDLSGGRPYEIQLLCHFLFRRVQEGRAERMRLTLDVLDDVLRELQTSQDVSTRPIISAIRNFDERQLSALRVLCACNSHANFDQIWFSEYVFQDEQEWTKELLQEHLRRFAKIGVVSIRNDIVSFAGDDFDRIYCKYLSRKYQVPLSINDVPYELLLAVRLDSFLRRELKLKGLEMVQSSSAIAVGELGKVGIKEIAKALWDSNEDTNPFQSTPVAAQEVYWASMEFQDSDSFQLISVAIITPWITVHRRFRCQDPNGDIKCLLDDFTSILAPLADRAAAVSGDLKVEVHTLPVVPVEVLARKVEQSGNIRIREDLFYDHLEAMVQAYTVQHDTERALLHGELAYRYNPDPQEPMLANNLGYLFLVSGNLLRSSKLLEKALGGFAESDQKALPNYNLGVLRAKEGNVEAALAKFRLAVKQIQATSQEAKKCACLLLPKVMGEEEKLGFEEVIEPDLLETAQAAAATMERFLHTE
jgi:hypothetical protein